MICPKCKTEKNDVRFFVDCWIDDKFEYCIFVCGECDNSII